MRFVALHMGARDRYQLPIALHERGLLGSFVTDFYSPLDKAIPSLAVQGIPSLGQYLGRRYDPALPSSLVKCSPWLTLLNRSGKVTDMVEAQRLLGEQAAEIANDRGFGVFSTSYYAWSAFSAYRGDGARILFQIHPQVRYLRSLFSRERNVYGPTTFGEELELQLTEELVSKWDSEVLLADRIVVSSEFTRTSILEEHPSVKRVEVVPYGVNTDTFFEDYEGERNESLRILYVGQRTWRKGYPLLMSSWTQSGLTGCELLVTGMVDPRFAEVKSVKFVGRLSSDGLRRAISSSDVTVVPSFAEGFSHVILESLACGTPVLCSKRCAGPDILEHGRTGFILEELNAECLVTWLKWCRENVLQLRGMRRACRDRALELSWPRFRSELIRNAGLSS